MDARARASAHGMLHITNGASAAQGIRDAGLSDEVLCWNDVLHEGPVPPVSDADFDHVRSKFIADCGWDRYERARAAFARRAARLREARTEDEVVLWFEHDLFDQLQLLEVLTRLAPKAARPPRVFQIATNQYLGNLAADWFRSEFTYREPVDDATWQEAVRVWAAFTAPDPRDFDRLRSTVIELPYLANAMTRHLQEFPSVQTGLSRFEGQLLNALADGPQDLLAAYHASHHDAEEAIFLGDTVFAWHLARLSRGDGALLKRLDGLPVEQPRQPDPEYWEQRVLVTPLAEQILAGQAERVAFGAIDRWLGGVHLAGHHVPWRWDEAQNRIAAMP